MMSFKAHFLDLTFCLFDLMKIQRNSNLESIKKADQNTVNMDKMTGSKDRETFLYSKPQGDYKLGYH